MSLIPVGLELPPFEREVLIHVEGHDGFEFDDIAVRADYQTNREGWAWLAERPYALGHWFMPNEVVAWCEIPTYSAAFTVVTEIEDGEA